MVPSHMQELDSGKPHGRPVRAGGMTAWLHFSNREIIRGIMCCSMRVSGVKRHSYKRAKYQAWKISK
jgi:hypothetical protein